jgi:hypothetical protein
MDLAAGQDTASSVWMWCGKRWLWQMAMLQLRGREGLRNVHR